jgi:hypothetical protein
MMLWITVAAASAQLSAPIPANLHSWATYSDVPMDIVPEGPQHLVGFRVTVDLAGKPQSCRVDLSSGIPRLDRYSCDLVMKRARFIPAKDAAGTPVYGVYESNLTWWVGDVGPPPRAPFGGDLDLLVNSLPAGTQSPIGVRIMFAVDAQGKTSSCTQEGEPGKTQAPPELAQLACTQALQQLKIIPATDVRGTPVPSIQDAEVRFSTK